MTDGILLLKTHGEEAINMENAPRDTLSMVRNNLTGYDDNYSLPGAWLYAPQQDSSDTTVFYSVFSFIFFLGIVGNSLLIVILVRHKALWTVPNSYILSLAVADLVTMVSCSIAPLVPPWFCSILHFCLQTAMCVTSWNLVALSVERYYAVVKPFSSVDSTTPVTMVGVIWFFSIIYTAVNLLLLPPPTHVCVLMFNPSSYAAAYTAIHFLVFYCIPLLIIGYFYILLAINIYYSDGFLTKDDKRAEVPPHIKARRKISLMVLVLVLMYAGFFFPFNYFSLRLYLNPSHAFDWSTATNVIYCVGCVHNSLNPVILYLFSESFRKHFNMYFNCFNCKTKPYNKKDSSFSTKS